MTELDNESVTEAELFVQRGEDGELLPTLEEAPGVGHVRVLPMTYGGLREKFGSSDDIEDVSSEVITEVLRDHVVEPDLSGITVEQVENDMKPTVPQSLIFAIMEASGVDFDSLQEQEEEYLAGN